MASNAVNGCPSIRVIIQQCLSAKLQVQPPTEDSDAQWVEVRNDINSGGPIIQTLGEEGGLALAPWAQFCLKIGWDHMLPSSTPPPHLSVDVPQTKRKLSVGFMLLNPLPTKDENIHPVWGHSMTQTIYIQVLRKMKSPKVKSFELPRINEHQSLRKVAGCSGYLALVGKGLSRLQTLTSSSWQILHFSLHVILIYWIIGGKHNTFKETLLG